MKQGHIDIVLAPAQGDEPFSLFVEIEVDGKSVRLGTMVKRADGLHALRITADEIVKMDSGL